MKALISILLVSLLFVMAATQAPRKVSAPPLQTEGLDFKRAALKMPPKALMKEIAVLNNSIKEFETVKKEVIANMQASKVIKDSVSVVYVVDSIYSHEKQTWIKRVVQKIIKH